MVLALALCGASAPASGGARMLLALMRPLCGGVVQRSELGGARCCWR